MIAVGTWVTPRPPAQIRTSPIKASGSYLGCLAKGHKTDFICGFRTRSSAWDTLSRICVRRVLCWLMFPLVPAFRSTASAAGFPVLFGSFVATIAEF